MLGARAARSLAGRRDPGRRRQAGEHRLSICSPMSGGWNPSIALSSHLGGAAGLERRAGRLRPRPSAARHAGGRRGGRPLPARRLPGKAAREPAPRRAEACGFKPARPSLRPRSTVTALRSRPLWRVKGSRGKAFVDFQNDVTVKDVELAEREGFRSVEHLKRYTTLGMATDQGKTANVNGLAIMAELTGRSIPETGTTRLPPALCAGRDRRASPAIIAARISGRPACRPPTNGPPSAGRGLRRDRHVAARPMVPAARREATGWPIVDREVKPVREAVGVCDVSTLGKIDVQGPTPARSSTGSISTPSRPSRWARRATALMLREDGIVMDDGTTVAPRRGPLLHDHDHGERRPR